MNDSKEQPKAPTAVRSSELLGDDGLPADRHTRSYVAWYRISKIVDESDIAPWEIPLGFGYFLDTTKECLDWRIRCLERWQRKNHEPKVESLLRREQFYQRWVDPIVHPALSEIWCLLHPSDKDIRLRANLKCNGRILGVALRVRYGLLSCFDFCKKRVRRTQPRGTNDSSDKTKT